MMTFRPRTASYDGLTKTLHWLAALLLLAMLAGGLSMLGQDRAARAGNLSAHSGVGLVLITLTLVRFAWRKVRPPLALPRGVPAARARLAGFVHRAFYIAILFQGAVGIWMAASLPLAVRPFDGFDLGLLAPTDLARADALRGLHQAGAWFILALVVLHFSGAIWHHFIRRDDVLVRMLPGSGLWYRLTGGTYAQAWRFPSSSLGNWPKRLDWDQLRAGGK